MKRSRKLNDTKYIFKYFPFLCILYKAQALIIKSTSVWYTGETLKSKTLDGDK